MDSRGPLVTIGLPVLNGERWLDAALDSLLAQTVEDFELLIADNASTDGTSQIVEKYERRDRRVRSFRHARQHGAAANFNFLAQSASGRFFKWAAHDDLVAPDLLARCVPVLEMDPSTVVCAPLAAEIDQENRVLRQFPRQSYGLSFDPVQRARAFFAQPTACLETYGLIRTATLRQTRLIGPYVSSDRVLLLELALRGRTIEVPELQFFCRTHPMRSLERSSRARSHWYAGSRRPHAPHLPKWRLSAEYARAIARAPLTARQKAACTGALLDWMDHQRGAFGRELVPESLRSTVSSVSLLGRLEQAREVRR